MPAKCAVVIMLQIYPDGIRHIRADKRVNEWRTPGKKNITKCAVNLRQVVIALTGGELVYFEMDPVSCTALSVGLHCAVCCNYDNGEISRVWQWTIDTTPWENNVMLKINVTNSFSLPLFSPSHSPSWKIHREIKGIHNLEMAVIQKNISILSYSVLSVLL